MPPHQGCHQLNVIAGKANREMALNKRYEDKPESRNEENHSNHLFLHMELQKYVNFEPIYYFSAGRFSDQRSDNPAPHPLQQGSQISIVL